MARATTTTKKAPKGEGFALSVIDKETVEAITENCLEYGLLTLEDRALPDYRDGLLKVHRRTLWAASKIAPNHGPVVKTARVIGDVLGKYHPHGDQAVSAAIETMVWSPEQILFGEGNWGSQTDKAAAYRYTNLKVSAYASNTFLDPRYLTTVNMHPNYDGKDEEPELLPAKLPNVLINGAEGIAVGLSTRIMAFEKAGVLTLLKGMLKGRKLTVAACLKNLVPRFSFGGNVPKEDWQMDALSAIMTTGKASLWVYCDYELDRKTRTLTITGIPPRLNPDTLMDKLRDTDFFTSVQDCTGKESVTPADIQCVFKRALDLDEAEEYLYENIIWAKIPFQMAVVERQWSQEEQKVRSKVHQWGVIELMNNWLGWRRDLEERMLAAHVLTLQGKIDRRSLLLIAQENRQLLAKSWEVDDQIAWISKQLKITADDAKYVAGLQLRQLAKLDREKLQGEITSLEVELAETNRLQASIDESILTTL